MGQHTTVSQEFIQFGANKLLGAELLALVEKYHDDSQTDVRVTESHIGAITDLIRKHTNLDIHPAITYDYDISIAILKLNGHQGTDGKGTQQPSIKGGGKDHKIIDATIDLKNARVTGAFALLQAVLFIPEAFLRHDGPLSPEETTAMILHEVGHQFFNLATIGEYAWLNYYLTEGVEVLLGKAPNTYRVTLLDREALTNEQSDRELRDKLTNNPTQANLRQAVLTAYRHNRRHQLGSIRGTLAREEQLADMFAARLGFSRPLATAIYKLSHSRETKRFYGNMDQRRRTMTFRALSVVIAQTAVVPTALFLSAGVVVPVLIAAGIALSDRLESRPDPAYDNPTERITKLRRELIAQLRSTETSQVIRDRLDDDIRAIEALLTNMNQVSTLTEAVTTLTNPTYRRQRHRQQHEELLETLLNNDLFAVANRFRR